MPVGATIAAVGTLGSAAIGAYGSIQASKAQAAAAQSGINTEQGMFGTAQQALQPYISGGTSVLPTIEALLQPGPSQTNTLSQLPGFQFANFWGQQAARNQGTTLGLGGNTLAAGSQYATGLAQQNWTQYLNPLLALYQQGGQAAGALAGNATQTGSNIANTYGQLGSAQAAGTLGVANSIGTGLSGAGNSFLNAALLSRVLGGGAQASGIYATPLQQLNNAGYTIPGLQPSP